MAAVLDYGYEVSNIWILYNLFDVLLDFEKYLLTEWEGCTGKYLPTGKDIKKMRAAWSVNHDKSQIFSCPV